VDASGFRRTSMSFELALGLILAVLLLGYLVYALLKPERF
jgi:K+-transporting ATPase KdpF subunit